MKNVINKSKICIATVKALGLINYFTLGNVEDCAPAQITSYEVSTLMTHKIHRPIFDLSKEEPPQEKEDNFPFGEHYKQALFSISGKTLPGSWKRMPYILKRYW